MISALRSLWIWCSSAALILLWLPLVLIVRLFDRDPVRYRTGRWFRRLGNVLTKANPSWRVRISGVTVSNPRRPYVVVSNHQSLADIPIISNLPWEMKWMAKTELFRVPVVGWMMRLAGDILVDRNDRRSGARAMRKTKEYLQNRCSVIIFPEGTRSPDGRVGAFNDGAFHLAISERVPILPIAVEGSRNCLPKKSWRFGPPQEILLKVLPPVETEGLNPDQHRELRDAVRRMIVEQIAEWRGASPDEVDGLRRQSEEHVSIVPI